MKKILAFVLMMPLCGYSATYNVTTTTDGTLANELRGAILAADAAGGVNTILVPAGTYVLSMGAILFGNTAETITIVGAGASSTIIQMGTTNRDRILNIDYSGQVANVNVIVQGVTMENGAGNVDNFGGAAILCGGVSNATTLENCIFLDNSDYTGSTGGGVVAVEGGGSLAVTNCQFTNNVEPSGVGGAIFYTEPGNANGALLVTGSVFSGNSAGSSAGSGGAINISAQGNIGPYTSTISIQQNTFIRNFVGTSVSAPLGQGGAISIDNAFEAGNTAFINYNRFYGNIAGSIPDVLVGSGQGNVDLTNNWWGSNAQPAGGSDPHALLQGSGGGTMTYSPWLELEVSPSPSSLCAGSGVTPATLTAGFFSSSSGAAVSVADLGALVGLPVTFSATLGTLSSTTGTIAAGGTATDAFSPDAVSGTAAVHVVVDSVSATDAVAASSLTLSAPTALPSSSTSGTIVIGGTEPVTDASCEEIASIVGSGASPVSGSVTVGVTLDGSVQSYQGVPYVTRHYDITPASGASTATATVTLYYLQSEFNAYNAVVNDASMELPTSSTDAAGAGRLTITQYHGSGTTPGNYSGWTGPGPASVLISPGSSNVVWNSAKNWWEVSFPVTGFSGFYVAGPVGLPLPVVLERFTGVLQGVGVLLNWQVGLETGLARYEVEGSRDGVAFSALGTVAAAFDGAGSAASGAGGSGAYQYFVADPAAGVNYYRLKMVNDDGTFTYSPVVVVDVASGASGGVVVLSNPFTTSCTLRVTAASGGPVNVRLMDLSGKVLWVSPVTFVAGVNTFVLPGVSGLAPGVYLVSLVGGEMREVVKVVKE